MKARVIIYSRPGCHLCEDARRSIEAADCQSDYTLDEVNIETDPELLRKYQYDIPVVTINGVERFKYYVSSKLFSAAIAELDSQEPRS